MENVPASPRISIPASPITQLSQNPLFGQNIQTSATMQSGQASPRVPVAASPIMQLSQNPLFSQNTQSAQNVASSPYVSPYVSPYQNRAVVPPPQPVPPPRPLHPGQIQRQQDLGTLAVFRKFLLEGGFFYRFVGGRIGLIVHQGTLRKRADSRYMPYVLQSVRLFYYYACRYRLPIADTIYIGPKLEEDGNGVTTMVPGQGDFVSWTRAAYAVLTPYHIDDCPFGGDNYWEDYAEHEKRALKWICSITECRLKMSDLQ